MRFLSDPVAPEGRGRVDEGGGLVWVRGGGVAVQQAHVDLREFNVGGEVLATPVRLEGGKRFGDPRPRHGDLIHETGGGGVGCVRNVGGQKRAPRTHIVPARGP